MDLAKVLAQLRGELENLDSAIESLERLQQTERRRGQLPPAPAPVKKRGRPPGSERRPGDTRK